MGDFKIKSAAGSGNKTLLQGQDQIDSAYAIEIGDAGATTLTNATLTAGSLASGVTGGSGLTALGTVTAGTLASGVTGGSGLMPATPYAEFWDQKNASADGGTFTNGAWRARELNSHRITIVGASLAANQITLPAGTYLCEGSAPARNCGAASIQLVNITDSSAILISGDHGAIDSSPQTYQGFRGKFTLSGSKVLEIQHQCSSTIATYGLGGQVSWAVGIFAKVLFIQIG